MKLGQIQWILFFMAIFVDENFFIVWLFSLFFTNYDD